MKDIFKQKYPIFASLQTSEGNKKIGSRGRVARQSSAKARTAVRIRSRPQNKFNARGVNHGLFTLKSGCIDLRESNKI